MHKSGFVNIIGNPNVGKSTLMNALVGEKLSIITSKAQTTRHRILGIVNGDDFLIVFSDTPGILKPCYKLQESMMNFVRGALSDADVLLYGIGRAMDLAQRRGLSRVEQETLREEGAVAEALGFYLSADGRVVGGGSSLAFKPEDIGRKNRAAAVAAGRAKAEAILAVCAHHPHKLLVVDEGAALRMIELLRR